MRDRLLGKTAADYDLATALTPSRIKDALPPGVTVIRENTEMLSLTVAVGADLCADITTFRAEFGPYKNRKPARVVPVGRYELDALRRDFRVNAMAVTPSGQLIDPVGGLADLEGKWLCSVGDPYLRFAEDPLRVLRLWRFAFTLGFGVEKHTARAAAGCLLRELKTGPALIHELAYWKDQDRQTFLPDEVAEFVRQRLNDR